jgi:hypothetical protein
MRYAAEVLILAQNLGGWDALSHGDQILVEKAAYLRIRTVDYEVADLKGNPLPFDGGVYGNKANVLHGHLKTLYARVLKRQAKPVRSLREIMNGSDEPEVRP